MSEGETPEVPATALGPVRPLSIRITDGLRTQLEVIAQLNDRSVSEEIRLALESWIETSKSDPRVLQRAETVRAELEAQKWQSAIEAIFGETVATPKGSTLHAPTRIRHLGRARIGARSMSARASTVMEVPKL